MKVVITSITLKNPLKFFSLSYNALRISKQLKNTPCKGFKSTGFWLNHYTMTMWDDESDMKAFAFSGAHLESMKLSRSLAKEIRTTIIDTVAFPKWSEARALLKEGKVLSFNS